MSETPFVIGLTGGIGSGKSAAADLFAARGALMVDTDQIAHQLTAPGGAAMEPIREAFGNGVVAADGALNRPAMRALAFEDPDARKRLEAILHPMIRAESERQCRAATTPYVVLVVGGADGLDAAFKAQCHDLLRLSNLTLPYGMVRVLLAEQLYRAVSILNNHPYHRE